MKLEDWKAAVESASAALDSLGRLDPKGSTKNEKDTPRDGNSNDEGQVVEIQGEDDATETAELERLRVSDERKGDIARIRSKALMRRAKAKTELGGWGNLQGAEDGTPSTPPVSHLYTNPFSKTDYKALTQIPSLPPADRRLALTALRTLPPRIAAAKEREMADMMGKLKELGNGILKPFGLSTDNFKMTKDEKSGGYSMQFNQ